MFLLIGEAAIDNKGMVQIVKVESIGLSGLCKPQFAPAFANQ
jgi:hypothetical protein